MRKRIFLYLIFLCLSPKVFSQSKIIYNSFFDYNTGYCPGDSQYDHWVDFLNSMDTSADKFLRLTMKGTYDMTGKVCADKYAVRQIADALYNRYDTKVYCDGNYWSVGTGCSQYNCGSYSDYMELTLNSNTCNCGVSYTIRPGMTSADWGGIATETCQSWAQNASQYMALSMQRVYGTDNLSLVSNVSFDECLNAQPLRVVVGNSGTNKVSSYKIGYIINGVLQTPISVASSVDPDALTKITLVGTYNLVPNRVYNFKFWTYDPNGIADSDMEDDTFSFTYKHSGTPALPSSGRFITCGQGKTSITAASNDSVAWYDQPSGGKLLFLGESFTTPYLRTTDTFYAEAVKFKSGANIFGTGFNNYTTLSGDQNEYNGGFFKLNVKEVLNISGIKVQSLFGNTNPHYKVYIREGGFAGYERDSTTWTRVFDAELSNGSFYNTIPLALILKPGIDYGLYLTTDPANGEDVWMNFGSYAYNNSDMTVEGGAAAYGKFGSIGIFTPWTIDMELLYEKTCKSSGRQAVEVVVNPRPSGSELSAAANFQGQAHLGIPSDPDVSEPGKSLTYVFSSPSGYDNKNYDTTWDVNEIVLQTEHGTIVPPSLYSFVKPGVSGMGSLTFVSDSFWIDSTIIIKLRMRDKGPYFCDSVIIRVVHIAPVPKPAFKVISTICEGSEVYFSNLSTIHSGRMNYMWYFSPTDSSDFFEPVHRFDSFGVFPVRLVVTSEPYHIRRDTVFMVNINGVPDVDFNITNACQGSAVIFTNATKGNAGLISYKWDFGDQTPVSTSVNAVHTYAVPSGYRVSLKADLNGCTDTMTRNAYLFSKPVVDFTAPVVPLCQSSELFFVNKSTIYFGKMGALWSFGDGQYSSLRDAQYKFSGPGSYKVQLKMTSEFDCSDSLVRTVIIKPSPIVDFTYDKLCSKDSTHFTNLTTEFPNITSNYIWSFENAPDQHTKNVSKKWSLHGPQTIKLVSVLSNGCASETERTLEVLLQPQANFKVDNICSGESAVFVNLSTVSQGLIDFLWSFGDSTITTTAANAQHTYRTAKSRIFIATLVASSEGGCKDSIKRPVKVNELPNCGFKVVPFSSVGNKAFKFTPENGTYTEYDWFFGEGGSSKNKSPIYQYLYPGSYIIKLKAKNAEGCECEQSFKLKFDATGKEDISLNIFSIYPNPADESINIKLTDSQQGTVNIYNYLGEMIMTLQLQDVNTRIVTRELSSGPYIIEVVCGDKCSHSRFNIIH